jgi:hypothetical protein
MSNLKVTGSFECESFTGEGALALLNRIYPINSIYMSVGDTSPASFLGGTWEKIQDRFLLASGSSFPLGQIGGEETHLLTINEMPSHRHPIGQYQDNFAWFVYAGRSGDGRYGIQQDYVAQKISASDADLMWAINQGGSEAHNNMPPYLAVNIWKRIS